MNPQRLAVFDLDRTLTRRDSYLPYLLGYLIRRPWRIVRTCHLPWRLVLFSIGWLNNEELKRHFLQAILGGAHRQELHRWTQTFVDRLVARGLWNGALGALERHRLEGDRLVLLSASFDFYVEELGRRLGFDHVICTKAEWVGDCITGNLAGPNCYGSEKLRRLTELRAAHGSAPVVAYADHQSDLPLLRLADLGILINGTSRAKQLAEREGIRCQDWRNSPVEPSRFA